MPRYIDADAFVKRLKHSPLFLGTNMQFKDGVVDLVERQPTADVAPMSEVESLHMRLVSTYEKLDDAESEVERLEAELAKAKKKVASEIFEEIEKQKTAQGIVYLFTSNYAELKKKYTEGE